jgi:transcription antitermination factor NusB
MTQTSQSGGLDRQARRRARELALQLLFSLDMNPPQGAQGVNIALHRGRERALIAEAELAFADSDLPRAEQATVGLLRLDPRDARAREYRAALDRKGPMPLPLGPDERDEYAACAATSEVLDLADALTRGVMGARAELDAHIGQTSTNWRVARMALVDRNILRLACHELVAMPETPVRVILNEAIEIAKRFGTAESRAFINGVLDRLAASLRPADLPSA